MWNGGYFAPGENMMTAELWDTTTNILLVTKTIMNTGAYGTTVSDSISTTSPLTIGNTIEMRFTGLDGTGVMSGNAAALDSVMVVATPPVVPGPVFIDTNDNGVYE
jgi:hypothetical protein